MLCDDFKTSDPPGNVNFGYGNRRRLALTSDLGSNPAGTAYYPRCVEMSELVGTMLVQINEGSFNFTGMCTHCSFSQMLRGPLWAPLRGRGGWALLGADIQVEGNFMV